MVFKPSCPLSRHSQERDEAAPSPSQALPSSDPAHTTPSSGVQPWQLHSTPRSKASLPQTLEGKWAITATSLDREGPRCRDRGRRESPPPRGNSPTSWGQGWPSCRASPTATQHRPADQPLASRHPSPRQQGLKFPGELELDLRKNIQNAGTQAELSPQAARSRAVGTGAVEGPAAAGLQPDSLRPQ